MRGCWWACSAANVSAGPRRGARTGPGRPSSPPTPAAGIANAGASAEATTTSRPAARRPRAGAGRSPRPARRVLPATSSRAGRPGGRRRRRADLRAARPPRRRAAQGLERVDARRRELVAVREQHGRAQRLGHEHARPRRRPASRRWSTSATAAGPRLGDRAREDGLRHRGRVGDRVAAADARRVLGREGREAEVGRASALVAGLPEAGASPLGVLVFLVRLGRTPSRRARGEQAGDERRRDGHQAGPKVREAGDDCAGTGSQPPDPAAKYIAYFLVAVG